MLDNNQHVTTPAALGASITQQSEWFYSSSCPLFTSVALWAQNLPLWSILPFLVCSHLTPVGSLAPWPSLLFSSHCQFHSFIHSHLVSSTPVSVKKPPSVIAAWQALFWHSKSPHSFHYFLHSTWGNYYYYLLLTPSDPISTKLCCSTN